MTIVRKSAGGDQVVDMRVIGQRAAPGVQDTDEAELAADEARIGGQVLRRRGRSAEEQIIEERLLAARHRPHRRGQGEGQHEVRHWEQPLLLVLQPVLRLLVLALGAMSVATRMILVDPRVAVWAMIDVSA